MAIIPTDEARPACKLAGLRRSGDQPGFGPAVFIIFSGKRSPLVPLLVQVQSLHPVNFLPDEREIPERIVRLGRPPLTGPIVWQSTGIAPRRASRRRDTGVRTATGSIQLIPEPATLRRTLLHKGLSLATDLNFFLRIPKQGGDATIFAYLINLTRTDICKEQQRTLLRIDLPQDQRPHSRPNRILSSHYRRAHRMIALNGGLE